MKIDQPANPKDTYASPTIVRETHGINVDSLEASAESLELLAVAVLGWSPKNLNIAIDFFDTVRRLSTYYKLPDMEEYSYDHAESIVEAECAFLRATIDHTWMRLAEEWKDLLYFRNQKLEQVERIGEQKISNLLEACQLPVDDKYARDMYTKYQHRNDEGPDHAYDDEYTSSGHTDDGDDGDRTRVLNIIL